MDDRHTPVRAPRLVRRALAIAALAFPAAFAPSTVSATSVSMGYSHGCAVDDTHQPTCWGSQSMQDLAPDTVLDVRAGRDFSCALLSGRTVRCWGNNDFSQLGVNAPTTAGPGVGGLWRFTQLAVGATHACALLDTQAYCWGDGSRGQLGAGSADRSAAPIAVAGLTKAVYLAAGQGVTCVVQWDAKVVCVGLGSELSGGLDEPRAARTVPGITDAREVALFDGHACVLRAGGKVSCWGRNSHGQLGMPASDDIQRSPVEVTSLGAAAKAVTVGKDFSCALLEGGTVKCWGNNTHGQLGTALGGTATGLVTGITTATAISAGQTAACAALHGGYVQCWGQGTGWGGDTCGVLGGIYPEHPASWPPVFDIAICRPPGSQAPMAIARLGAASDAAQVLDWAEKAMPGTFPAQGSGAAAPGNAPIHLRQYPGGHTLGVNAHGTPHLLYLGPFGNGGLLDLGPLDRWLSEARQEEGVKSGLQLQAMPYLNLMPGVIFADRIPSPCSYFLVPFAIRGGANGLPQGLVATSVRVQNTSGTAMEFPIREQYRQERVTTDTDWMMERILQPGQAVPAGMKQETVLAGAAAGCPVAVRTNDEVGVAVLYTLNGRKGQLRTSAKVTAAY